MTRMRKIIIAELITIDGKIAAPGNTMQWMKDFFSEEIRCRIGLQQDQVDTLLLGRVTYQRLQQYTIAARKRTGDSPSAIYLDQVRKIVFSRTISRLHANNATLAREINPHQIRQWLSSPGKDMAIVGSASIAQAFINLGLVQEYQLLIHPLMLAGGKALFANIRERHSLKPVRTEVFKNGVIGVSYRATAHQ